MQLDQSSIPKRAYYRPSLVKAKGPRTYTLGNLTKHIMEVHSAPAFDRSIMIASSSLTFFYMSLMFFLYLKNLFNLKLLESTYPIMSPSLVRARAYNS